MKEKTIIVGVNLNNQDKFDETMVELKNLCEACEMTVVGAVTQNAKVVNPKWYVGKGKLDDLVNLIHQTQAESVVFNCELTPSQIRNIKDAVQVTVIDRTTLILRIFALRAKTREAKLQVELVRLQYEMPRLIGFNDNLSRQGGGMGGGAGGRNKGAGETKLELDRRSIVERITSMTKELENLKVQRQTQRNKRRKYDVPTVALVGYTNAGKSSIMNYMVQRFIGSEDKQVFEKDMLFATLETSVREIKLSNRHEFLLSDTVGFVSNLPHNLVKAFRSTLEEVCEADLLLHVVDRSNPDYKVQMEVTNDTLKEIGADQIPMLYVYNKMDLCESVKDTEENMNEDMIEDAQSQSMVEEDEGEQPNEITPHHVSAKSGEGMDALLEDICSKLYHTDTEVHIFVPYSCGAMIAKINANTHIVSQKCLDDGIDYVTLCSPQMKEWIESNNQRNLERI